MGKGPGGGRAEPDHHQALYPCTPQARKEGSPSINAFYATMSLNV